VWTHLIPATLEGRAVHNVQNAMFAAAMAFSMGVKLEDIRHGLRTFDTTFFQAPGRMNVFDELPFKVIVDYGHNAPAVEVMCQLVQRLEPKGRKLVVLSAPGDRRDEDVQDIAKIAAGRFDRYIVRRDDQLRGRAPEEVPHMLRDTLIASGVSADRIEVVPEEPAAVAAALNQARPGDLLLIFADQPARTWKQVIQFRPDAQTPAERIPRPVFVEVPEVPAMSRMENDALVRDERGVRLARETED
jgi:cyanophycin synthetase